MKLLEKYLIPGLIKNNKENLKHLGFIKTKT